MRTKVKICGLTDEREVEMLKENRADYGGIVLYFEKSKRNCEPEQAKKLVKLLKQAGIASVAVTVSPTLLQVQEIERSGFDFLQVHGELETDVLEQTTIPLIRAFNLNDRSAKRTEREAVQDNPRVVGWLLDAASPGAGKTFDWSLLQEWKRDHRLLFLAGGLNPENVREAIEKVQPDVADVSSGVELDSEEEIRRLGLRKDAAKISAFVRSVKEMQ